MRKRQKEDKRERNEKREIMNSNYYFEKSSWNLLRISIRIQEYMITALQYLNLSCKVLLLSHLYRNTKLEKKVI